MTGQHPDSRSGSAVRNSLAGLAANDQRLQPGRRFGLIFYALPVAVAAVLLVIVLINVWQIKHAGAWSSVLAVLALVLVVTQLLQVRRQLILPMRQLRSWAVQMCSGDLGARIESPSAGEFSKLVFHVNRLSEALDRLANDMDDIVVNQTEQLQGRNQSLETLYEVAAALNRPSEFDAMLVAAIRPLTGIVDGTSAFLIVGADENCRFLDVIGMQAVVVALATGDLTGPGPAVVDDITVLSNEAVRALAWPVDIVAEHVVLIRVPVSYRQRLLGTVILTGSPERARDDAVGKLLLNVGAHLGMAMEKHYSDVESRNVSIVRERNALAHELHDSLAQTVASLGMQISMLQDSIDSDDWVTARREAVRAKGAVDEAHLEIRELLASFRAPVDHRGLLPALVDLTDRARSQSDCKVYLQHEGEEPDLSPTAQLQVTRIVSEALANARKSSGAQMLRVLVRSSAEQGLSVLVEDDGRGIGEQILSAHPGEHLGLSIMRERAQRAGGWLNIESEPDEGTRIELKIPPEAMTVLSDSE